MVSAYRPHLNAGQGRHQYGERCPTRVPERQDAVFSLEQGDGTYTIFLCENISGTTYRVVTSKRVNAKIENAYAPYLIATTDVQFTSGDDVCKKAAELCKDAKTDMDKVTAIYNYIAGHYTYDTKLASGITAGKVSKYIPDTAATLSSNKGICYDLASAAMYRNQNLLHPHQGLRRQQLPRLEQGQRQRQLVPDRHDLCRHQARHQRDHLRRLRLLPDLLPAERHARRVRGGVNPHNSSKDGGTGRYVALVDFNTNATVADAGWQDVSAEAGYTAILTAINDLKPDGGTNLDDGLQNANLLFAKSNVQEIDSKNIIALTDGEPTYYMTKDIFGNPTVGGFGNSCTKEVFEATANTAASICNSGTTLYSICFGAANEEVKNPNTGAYNI